MALIVQKFGGTSVANAQRISNVADIVAKTYNAGNDVVVVVSAQGDTTDDLIAKAAEINDNASRREMDMLMSAGEQISIALLAMALQKRGIPAISLLGWQAGIDTDSNYSNARIKQIRTERIEGCLARKNVVVVAGFQGINKYDDVSTLGRGGSDTSAVALAAALSAQTCQIFTDVDGVYTTDPRICKDALKLDEITYDEMLELASLGANVLHHRSVELAKKYNVDLEVISSLTQAPGTKVKETVKMEKMLVRGVTRDNDTARIAIIGVQDEPGIAFKIFSLIAAKKIEVDIILQSIGRDGTKDISFTVHESDLKTALEILNENNDRIRAKEITYDDNISKVSIVGAGMASNAGIAAKMFEAMYAAGINIKMINTSEIKVSVLIDRSEADAAVRAVHEAFFPKK